jgi:hypothetical protein
LKAKKSKSKERGEQREVKQEEEKKKKNPTLSSSCTDVAVIKEKQRSKSLSRSTPDINHGRSVSRSSRQIDVPRLPFKDKPLNDKEVKIALSTLNGRHASFYDSNKCEYEGRRQEEEKKSHALSSSCTDVAVIKEKRSKSLSHSDPDVSRSRSVTRTRQIDIPRLPFKDTSLNDKEDKIALSSLKGRQTSFHDRFHDIGVEERTRFLLPG